MTEISIMIEFKTQLTSFFDELIAQFPNEGDLVVMRLYIATQMDIQEAINSFIYQLNTKEGETRDAINKRNESHFLLYNINPDTNQKYRLSHFKKLWMSGKLDTEDKTIIWKWIDTFIFLTEKYTKVKSGR
jgi:hypothetical protein